MKQPVYTLDLRRKDLGEDGITAAATISEENAWQPDVSIASHKDGEELGAFTPHEFFMLGMVLCTAEHVRASATEDSISLNRVEVTVQPFRSFVTTLPRQELGRGLVAVAEGYSKYSYTLRIKTGLPSDSMDSFKLKMGLISFSIRSFGSSVNKINIEMVD